MNQKEKIKTIAGRKARQYKESILARKDGDAPIAKLADQIEANRDSIIDNIGSRAFRPQPLIKEVTEQSTQFIKDELTLERYKGEAEFRDALERNQRARELVARKQ